MRKTRLQTDPRTLSACAIDGDRSLKVRVGILNGSVQVDLRAYLEMGRRSAKTRSGVYFSPKYLPRVIKMLQDANSEIESWELNDD